MRKKDRNSVVKVNKDRNYQTAVKTLEFKQIIINNSWVINNSVEL